MLVHCHCIRSHKHLAGESVRLVPAAQRIALLRYCYRTYSDWSTIVRTTRCSRSISSRRKRLPIVCDVKQDNNNNSNNNNNNNGDGQVWAGAVNG
jgi:hypothetical protein